VHFKKEVTEMAIKAEWIRMGEQPCYLARPEYAALPLPGVIVIQQVMGVDEHIEDVTRRIAAAGYAALAPDLYAVGGKRPDPLTKERIAEAMHAAADFPPSAMANPAERDAALGRIPEPRRSRIRETMERLFDFRAPGRIEAFMESLKKTYRALVMERNEVKGRKIGCVGFCMGGGLSALLACEEPGLGGAAVFYGSTPPEEKIGDITCPVIAFYGESDQRVNAGIGGFVETMAKTGGSFEHHVYKGAGHAFFDDSRRVYNVDAARDSWARLIGFFNRVLTG
jgi:carboxymethylenebutenolidase